jgi:hypothetical protein
MLQAAFGLGASVAYSRPRATSSRLIHARIHAQALTLVVLGGVAAFVHYRSSKTSKTGAASGQCRDGRSASREARGEGESWMDRSRDGGAAVEAAREEGVAVGPAAARGASAAVAVMPGCDG